METDNGKGDFVELAEIFFSKSVCSKREEIKESDADLDRGKCDVKGEISDLKTVYSWPHKNKHGGH